MKRAIVLAILLAITGLYTGYTFAKIQNKEAEPKLAVIPVQVKKISPSAAKKRLDSEKGIVLLDVRTEKEYNENHIPNSILLPLNQVENKIMDLVEDKDTIIFVYCKSGKRSASASEILVCLGYKQVYDLGGIKDWPYKTISSQAAMQWGVI